MIKELLNQRADKVQNALSDYLQPQNENYDIVIEAMRYAALCGGKRIRPSLLLEFYTIFGGEEKDAMPFACALEMIHTYSLIHDDLPCMDDDDMRRGKPSCHIAFPENIALLAGDALLTKAFEICAKANTISTKNALQAIALLAEHAGLNGMIGGQVIDLQSEGKKVSLELVTQMYALKTGALLLLTAKIAAALAGVTDNRLDLAAEYCKKVGLAFQIVDDLLDIEGTEEELGKPVGSDLEEQKSTLVSLIGVTKAKEMVAELSAEAKQLALQLNSQALTELVDYLVVRRK